MAIFKNRLHYKRHFTWYYYVLGEMCHSLIYANLISNINIKQKDIVRGCNPTRSCYICRCELFSWQYKKFNRNIEKVCTHVMEMKSLSPLINQMLIHIQWVSRNNLACVWIMKSKHKLKMKFVSVTSRYVFLDQ